MKNGGLHRIVYKYGEGGGVISCSHVHTLSYTILSYVTKGDKEKAALHLHQDGLHRERLGRKRQRVYKLRI